jgi:hypothetical protein
MRFLVRTTCRKPAVAEDGHVVTGARRALLLSVTLFALTGCNTRTPDRWEIQAGYVGWTIVQYEDPACAALPVSDGYKVIRLDDRGRACTTEQQEPGEAFDKFYYVDSSLHASDIDQGKLVWAGVYFATTKRAFHFIGPEAAYRASPDDSATLDRRCSADHKC